MDKDYCFNEGVCFQVKTVMPKACVCQQGFTGERCQFQNPIFTRSARAGSAFETDTSPLQGPLGEHSFAHAYIGIDIPVQRRPPYTEVDIGSKGSSSAERSSSPEIVLEDENRATRAKHDFLESLMKRNYLSVDGSEQKPRKMSLPVEKDYSTMDHELRDENLSQTGSQTGSQTRSKTESQTGTGSQSLLLSSILSRIMRIKQQQVQEKNQRVEQIL